jgi:hypothetical protein
MSIKYAGSIVSSDYFTKVVSVVSVVNVVSFTALAISCI